MIGWLKDGIYEKTGTAIGGDDIRFDLGAQALAAVALAAALPEAVVARAFETARARDDG